MRVRTAIKMLQDHGHKAFVCSEGVVAIGKATFVEIKRDDAVCEAYASFDVYMPETFDGPNDMEHVDGNAVRAYLGY